MRTFISGLGLLLTLGFAAPAHAAEIDWAKVDAALGKTASVQGEVHRYGRNILESGHGRPDPRSTAS